MLYEVITGKIQLFVQQQLGLGSQQLRLGCQQLGQGQLSLVSLLFGHHHTTVAEFEIEGFVEIFPLFQQRIPTDHTSYNFV